MLAGFKLVTEAKPIGNAAVQKDPIANFKGGIDKQLEFVELELAGKPLPMTNKGRKVRLAYFRKGLVHHVEVREHEPPDRWSRHCGSWPDAGERETGV
jgi:hypothetical protein